MMRLIWTVAFLGGILGLCLMFPVLFLVIAAVVGAAKLWGHKL